MDLIQITIILFGTISSLDGLNVPERRKYPISPEDRLGIIGGHEASIEDYPHQVSITWTFSNGETFFLCGGFIISANYILSAAHCIKGRDPSRIIVYAGSIFRTNGTIIPIAEVIGHPDFIFKNPMDKDVAIMKTVHPIDFSNVIKAVQLPRKNTPLEDNSLVTVTGWGLIALNESNPGPLMAVEIPVVNYYDCWSTYADLLTRNMWCGGNFQFGGIGPCGGDSGGAAVQNGVVFGIVSWSDSCALPWKPAVFADIAAPAVRDFISLHTGL